MEWFELSCRWILGLQFIFWGLNGFFHWKAIPPASDFITRFADICIESKFVMPTVKLFEIIFGALLLTGFGTLVALIFLGPIVFMIAGLHLVHNPKWYPVVLPILVPFVILVLMQEKHLQYLFH